MSTQKVIADETLRGQADDVVTLKGNYELLHQAVDNQINEQLQGNSPEAQEHFITERGHGRQEEQIHLQMPAPESLSGESRWSGLKSVDVVRSRRVQGE